MGTSKYLIASAAIFATVVVVVACTSSAVGVDACKAIETARCKAEPNCGGYSTAGPISRDGRSIDDCISYYDEECKHGLASNANPSSAQISACVTAITDGPCSVIVAPETSPACAFLIPPVTPDASYEAETSDEASVTEGGADGADGAD